jgi:hypothetical protein
VSPATLLLLGALTAQASEPAGMSSQDCIAATENFIELMKNDPNWQGHVSKPGQLPLMRKQALARCARTLEAEDIRKLNCLGNATKMREVYACIRGQAPEQETPVPPPPEPIALTPDGPISSQTCLKIHAHVFQILLSNPQINDRERKALQAGRSQGGLEAEAQACADITEDGTVLLRCLAAINTVPGMQGCLRQAKEALLKKATTTQVP